MKSPPDFAIWGGGGDPLLRRPLNPDSGLILLPLDDHHLQVSLSSRQASEHFSVLSSSVSLPLEATPGLVSNVSSATALTWISWFPARHLALHCPVRICRFLLSMAHLIWNVQVLAPPEDRQGITKVF